MGSSRSFAPLHPPLEHNDFPSARPALTPTLSPRERGRSGASTSFSLREKVAGASRPDEGLRRTGECARLPLAFALLAIFSTPTRADFRVCNKTHALINIAVGTDAGEAFRTEGWWVATPGSCATPVRGPLKSRFIYLYATDIDGVDLVTGTATMCIDRGKFVAYGAENCWRRGLQAVTFAEIDTLDSTDWTTFLADPRK
jgi:uncharacterized membrane protein